MAHHRQQQQQQQPTWQVKNESSFASVCVTLPPGTGFHCKGDAVVSMSHNVDVRGAVSGGVLAGLARAVLTRESFFTTQVRNGSSESAGDALIAPSDPGGIALHELVPGEDVVLTGGACLAADEGVEVLTSMRSPLSMFGNYSGTGIFLLRASGRGILAMGAYSSMHKYVLAGGERRNADNGHIVEWSSSMKTSMKFASRRSGMVGSMGSGEGLHCEFVGPGVVYVQSHKPEVVVVGHDGVARRGVGGGAQQNGGLNFVCTCILLVLIVIFLLGSAVAIYLGVYDGGRVIYGNGGYGDGRQQRDEMYGQNEL